MNAKSTKTETPAPKRTFEFKATTSIPIPQDIPTRSTELPFKAYFSENMGTALEGKQPHLFLPDAYWTEERGVDEKNVDAAYGRGKVRAAFNEWVKKDEPTRSKLDLTIVRRDGKSEDFPEPGISFWMVKK